MSSEENFKIGKKREREKKKRKQGKEKKKQNKEETQPLGQQLAAGNKENQIKVKAS